MMIRGLILVKIWVGLNCQILTKKTRKQIVKTSGGMTNYQRLI